MAELSERRDARMAEVWKRMLAAARGAQKLTPDDGLTQLERFIKAAQELGTDDDPERFKERVRKLAKAPLPSFEPKSE